MVFPLCAPAQYRDYTNAFRQLGLVSVGNCCHRLRPGLASWWLWQRFAIQHIIPTDFCYNSHRSIPLTGGVAPRGV
jgi:hypothetical protein